MKHRATRIWSFGLALVMALASIPVTAPVAWAAPNNNYPQLAFNSNYIGNDRSTANVITGRQIVIQETTPTGYSSSGIVMRAGAGTGTGTGDGIVITDKDTTHGVTISPRNNDGTRTITFDENFSPTKGDKTGVPTADDFATYSIIGNYYAIQATGEVVEKVDEDSPPSLGNVTSTRNQAIMQDSRIKLRCTKSETAGSDPAFEIVAGSASGDFKPLEAQGKVYVSGSTNKNEAFTGVAPARTISISIQAPGSAVGETTRRIDLTMDIKQTHGNSVANPGDPVTNNNFIEEDSTFELTFLMPTSDPILLTVMTPQHAIKLIEDQIGNCDGEKDQSFIRFAEGNDTNYVTSNFDLRRSTNQFGGSFEVKWSWHPEDTSKQDVLDPGGGNADWQTATVRPERLDVKGVLKPEVKYIKLNGDAQDSKSAAPPVKNLIIRGTGDPVGVTQVSQRRGVSADSGDGIETINYPKGSAIPDAKIMDAYGGGIPGFALEGKGPFEYILRLNMGALNGAAQYATVSLEGDTDAVALMTKPASGNFTDYTQGGQIANENFGKNGNTTPGEVDVKITAQHLPPDSNTKTVYLTVRFFIPDRNNRPQESSQKFRIRLDVSDSTPSQVSTLDQLLLFDGENNPVEFAFSPDQKNYTGNARMLHIPYKVKEFTLTPTLTDARGAGTPIKIEVQDVKGAPANKIKGDKNATEVLNGRTSEPIVLTEDDLGIVYRIIVTSPSQDPRTQFWTTYTIEVVRDHPSLDDTLAYLRMFYENADQNNLKNNLVPYKADQLEYDIYVPYSTRRLRVQAAKNHERAEGPEIPENINPPLVGTSLFDEKQWLTLRGKYNEDGTLPVTFTVKSEATVAEKADAPKPKEYKVTIHRMDPNNDPTLKSLSIADANDQNRTYRPTFNPDEEAYTVEIPYSVKQLKFNITPTDENVNNIRIYMGTNKDETQLVYSLWEGADGDVPGDIKIGSFTPIIPAGRNNEIPALNEEPANTKGYYPIYIRVTAEDEVTEKSYEIRVQRAEPSKDNLLKSLVLKDQENVQIKTLAFHPDEINYSLTVPFETTAVNFTPTANHEGATIEIRDGSVLSSILPYEVASGEQSKNFNLSDPGTEKEFQIIVTPEDKKAEKKTYYVRITRGPPSDDARLKALKTDNTSEFKPLFIASKTEYTAVVAEGAEGVIITATANHPGATIKINGQVVPSGTPSDLIELIEIKQTIKIEVTAQDGVTKKVYSIEFTNENLIEKTSNADLKRLSVNYGLITPEFKSSVTEYEVTATENTWSVDIIPRLADSYATMRVLNGTRELGDYNGNYSLALEDGENNITIEVTSPDKTVVKNYEVAVFRNEEDKLKNLTPLEAEDIDFERSPNPILVKIEEYPRVGASVFNTLREDYPEKSIVFQGNDYSLRFDASNLNRTIPQTEIYDFRMSFDSPDEDDIYDLIEEREVNDDILDDIVLLYFSHHGSLPGPASFRLSLGRKYANETLYWHYYNQERERIDYYGALKSNNKGNIAVTIDHFSTYIVSPDHRIAGSEDKAGIIDELGMVSNGKDLLGNGGKLNPDTGAGEERP